MGRYRYSAAVLVMFTFLFIAIVQGAYAMGGIGWNFILASPMEGVVVNNGEPVEGAVVKRTLHWKESSFEDAVVTTSAGVFALPERTTKALLWKFLPHEPVIKQKIHIEFEGKTYLAWRYTKHDYEMNGEREGRPLNLLCEIQAETRSHDITEDFTYYGMCTLR